MKREKLLNAIGKINDSLIEEALEQPIKTANRQKLFKNKAGSGWLKRVVIAACFCMVLSIPVFAIGHGMRVELEKTQHKWSVDTEGRFPLEAFSKEVLELVGELGSEDGMYPMEDIKEAEEFLGIDLPENTLLEKLPQKLIEQEWSDGSQISGNTIVYLFNGIEGDFVVAWVDEKYSYIWNEVWISYQLVTELNPYENGGGLSVTIKDDFSEQEMETYVTASGRECFIIYSKHENWCDGYAYMDIDGILTEVQIHGRTPECVSICIKEIMDAYE